MPDQTQSGMQPGPLMECTEVEALLADALDSALHGPTLAAFEAHQQGCAICRGMVEEARAGMQLLRGLDEAEPPRNLVHNILAQTIGALPSDHAVVKPHGEGWRERLNGRLAPMFAGVATPRFAMSFGMAFFSITMLLGIAGFHFADVRHWDFSAKGISRTYYVTEAHVMRYYENMRLVYEIESRVRDLRHAATPDEMQDNQPQPQQTQPQQEAPGSNQKNPSKSENRQHDSNPPRYGHDEGGPELAALHAEQRSRVDFLAPLPLSAPLPLEGRVLRDAVALKGRGYSRAVQVRYLSERASARDIPQARLVRRTA